MAGIKRIFGGNSKSVVAFEIEFTDGSKVSVNKAQLVGGQFNTDAKLNNYTKTLLSNKTTTPVYIHRNRSGTFAIALGEPPAVWPEDE